MDTSILNSTKKILGIDASYLAFDLDIITHINSTFSTLSQLGVGPDNGFMIEDDEPVWADFLLDDKNLNSVKTYMFLKVRFLFDPPATSFQLDAMQRQISELEWRLNAYKEDTDWVDPNPVEEVEM